MHSNSISQAEHERLFGNEDEFEVRAEKVRKNDCLCLLSFKKRYKKLERERGERMCTK